MSQHWTAEQTAHPDATNENWAIIYDPTPGGRERSDGTRAFAFRFPALLISDQVDNPEKAAKDIARKLNIIEELAESLSK